eukprot:1483063-Karenia_brevis.AAC.1
MGFEAQGLLVVALPATLQKIIVLKHLEQPQKPPEIHTPGKSIEEAVGLKAILPPLLVPKQTQGPPATAWCLVPREA